MAETKKKNPESKTGKRFTRRRKVKSGLLLLILLAGWWAWHQLTAPVTGVQIKAETNLKTTKIKKASQAEPTTVTSQYFQLSLPAGYHAQASSQTVPGLLQQKSIIKADNFGSTVINIAVKNIPEGGLQGDSSYAFRAASPSRYAFSSLNSRGQNIPVATDNQSAAVVGFWSRGGYLATISISTALGNPSPESTSEQLKVLQTVLDGWQWQ